MSTAEFDFVDAAIASDHVRFASWYDARRPELERMVRFHVPPGLVRRIDAADVVSDGFNDVCCGLGKFDPARGTLEGWVRMKVMDRLRMSVRRETAAGRDPAREIDDLGSLASALVAQQPSPSSAAGRAEIAGLMRERLEALSAEDRQLIVMFYYEELTMERIGQILGLAKQRVSERVPKALAAFRRLLPELDRLERSRPTQRSGEDVLTNS